jgi:hypothetical protein
MKRRPKRHTTNAVITLGLDAGGAQGLSGYETIGGQWRNEYLDRTR